MAIDLKKIKLHALSMTLNNPFTTSFGTVSDRDFYIIEAINQEGQRGFGESVAFSTPWYTEETTETNYHMMRDFLIPMLETQPIHHPDDVTKIFAPIRGNNMAKAAIEGAIWDLYAKQKNTPLSKALGGTKKTIDVGISIGIQPTMDDLLTTIKQSVQNGYKRVKLKIKPGHDMDVLEIVRQHFPDLPILADANSAYTLEDIEHLQQLDDFNLMMIEQPLGHDDIVDHATLQKNMATPICLDESIHSLNDVRHAIQLGSCQIINVKSGRVGGLTEAKRIHDYCAIHHMPVWCGGMLESGIGRAHNIALSTLPNFKFPGDIAGSTHYWQKDIITPEVVVNEGQIKISNQSGIGYELNHRAMKQFSQQVETFKFNDL